MAENETIKEKVKDKNASKNLKIRVLDEAFDSFKEIIDEYAQAHDLSEKDYETLLDLANKAYLEKKMTYFLEDKVSNFGAYLWWAATCALRQDSCKEDKYYDKIMYFKQLNHTFTNE